jgi:aryl-alcohol dehydrogenase-like predicted oxidoreductase
MPTSAFGRTGLQISRIGFGAWAIGGTWGQVDDQTSLAALHRAVEAGVNFFDTADVYGDGRSERLLARLRREVSQPIFIATKVGRRRANTKSDYDSAALNEFVDRSLENLGTEAIDLLQLHCPPTDVFYMPEVFAALDDLVKAGKIRFYGASVERVEEALKAIEYPALQSIQIVFNLFRQRPAELLFQRARDKGVAVVARLPLGSGMLTGKMTAGTTFAPDDHRSFNREGSAFDKGETLSGVDFDVSLRAVEELRPLVPEGATMAQWALRWILMHDAVTCAIPGAKSPGQVDDNVRAGDLPPIPSSTMRRAREIYDARIRPLVHHRW